MEIAVCINYYLGISADVSMQPVDGDYNVFSMMLEVGRLKVNEDKCAFSFSHENEMNLLVYRMYELVNR